MLHLSLVNIILVVVRNLLVQIDIEMVYLYNFIDLKINLRKGGFFEICLKFIR